MEENFGDVIQTFKTVNTADKSKKEVIGLLKVAEEKMKQNATVFKDYRAVLKRDQYASCVRWAIQGIKGNASKEGITNEDSLGTVRTDIGTGGTPTKDYLPNLTFSLIRQAKDLTQDPEKQEQLEEWLRKAKCSKAAIQRNLSGKRGIIENALHIADRSTGKAG